MAPLALGAAQALASAGIAVTTTAFAITRAAVGEALARRLRSADAAHARLAIGARSEVVLVGAEGDTRTPGRGRTRGALWALGALCAPGPLPALLALPNRRVRRAKHAGEAANGEGAQRVTARPIG